MDLARLRLIPLVLVALLAAACGSTVEGDPIAAGRGDSLSNDGLRVDDSGSTDGDASGGVDFGGTGDGGTAGSSSGGNTNVNGTASNGTAATSRTATGVSGPGVTAKEVYVGLIYDSNAGAVNQAAGVGSITSGDSKANTQAIVADINKRGGVGGRKLVAVYAPFDSTSSQTLDQQFAAVCQQFTQDNPRVFAAEGDGTRSYRECMSKAGVTILNTGLPTLGEAEMNRYPGFVEQGYPNIDRIAAYEPQSLLEQGYFSPWNAFAGAPAASGKAKVGILTYNDRDFSNAVDNILVPRLKKLGYDPIVEKIAPLSSAGDIGAQGAAVKSAQLAFAANNVTHVIAFEANGGLGTLFLPTARTQGYYPRYGVTTASASEALLESGIVDPRQMNGAVGFGWQPSVDLPSSYNPEAGPYSNENRRYCLKVMRGAGITFDSGNAEGIALNSCSNLYLLKAALDKTPSLITRSSFMSVVDSLGTSYQRAGGVGQTFKPGRHDSVDKVYRWKFYDDCTCFHYYGSAQTIP